MSRRSTLVTRSVPALTAVTLAAAIAGCGDNGLEVAGPAPNSSAAALTEIVGCTGVSNHAPARLQLRCSTPRLTLDRLRWRHWGGPTATATGVLDGDECAATDTDCSTPATVVARNLVLSARNDQYRSLSVTTGHGPTRRTAHFDVDDRGPTTR